MSCMDGIKNGWYGRSWPLRIVTLMLLLSMLLLSVSIACPFWSSVPAKGVEEGVDEYKNIGVFGYLFRDDVTVPIGAVPFLYMILAVISLIILLCDVILDVMFVTKNFYLVVPTVVVFSFIAGCMTLVCVLLWWVGHRWEARHGGYGFAYGCAAASSILDFAAALTAAVEFSRYESWRGDGMDRMDSTVRLATERLEQEGGTESSGRDRQRNRSGNRRSQTEGDVEQNGEDNQTLHGAETESSQTDREENQNEHQSLQREDDSEQHRNENQRSRRAETKRLRREEEVWLVTEPQGNGERDMHRRRRRTDRNWRENERSRREGEGSQSQEHHQVQSEGNHRLQLPVGENEAEDEDEELLQIQEAETLQIRERAQTLQEEGEMLRRRQENQALLNEALQTHSDERMHRHQRFSSSDISLQLSNETCLRVDDETEISQLTDHYPIQSNETALCSEHDVSDDGNTNNSASNCSTLERNGIVQLQSYGDFPSTTLELEERTTPMSMRRIYSFGSINSTLGVAESMI